MGCLCPRKVTANPPPTKGKERGLDLQAATQQDFMVQSERNKILPVSTNRKQNPQKNDMFSRLPLHPSEKTPSHYEDFAETKNTTGRSHLSGIIVSQLGGSKLERTISIISTEADIAQLNHSTSTTRGINQQMIVVSKDFEVKEKLRKIQKKYYSLIKNKLYVKKDTSNILKVRSLSCEMNLFCSLQTLRETIHAIHGIPIQNIKILTKQPLSYLIEDVYPLLLTIKYQCKKCGARKIKASSACKVVMEGLECKCGGKEFRTTEIRTSPEALPIWYEGKKMRSKEVDLSAGEFRIIGCNICWKLETCKPMGCGCLRCGICSFQHPNDRCILCL